LLIDLAAKPLDAFPQAAADWHQAKATYRFLANNRFAWEDLLVGWHVTTAQHALLPIPGANRVQRGVHPPRPRPRSKWSTPLTPISCRSSDGF
jgi:hypothetical protein